MKSRLITLPAFILFTAFSVQSVAQTAEIKGTILSDGNPVMYANVILKGETGVAITDTTGKFNIKNLSAGTYTVLVSCVGFESSQKTVTIKAGEIRPLNFNLTNYSSTINQVVVTGTMKAVSKLESPVLG